MEQKLRQINLKKVSTISKISNVKTDAYKSGKHLQTQEAIAKYLNAYVATIHTIINQHSLLKKA